MFGMEKAAAKVDGSDLLHLKQRRDLRQRFLRLADLPPAGGYIQLAIASSHIGARISMGIAHLATARTNLGLASDRLPCDLILAGSDEIKQLAK